MLFSSRSGDRLLVIDDTGKIVGPAALPGRPAVGALYIVGTAPTGARAGQANKLARWLYGMWTFFDAAIVVNLADNKLWIRGAAWVAVGP